jgi:hypothetical protein
MFLDRWLHDEKPHPLCEHRSVEKLRVCDGCWQTAGPEASQEHPAPAAKMSFFKLCDEYSKIASTVIDVDVQLGAEIRCTAGDGTPLQNNSAAAVWMFALHEVGVSAISLHRVTSLLSPFKYRAELDVRVGGTHQLTDATGDTYTLRCLRAGKHSVSYNSGDPTIKRVTSHPLGLSSTGSFEVANAVGRITSLGGTVAALRHRTSQPQPSAAEDEWAPENEPVSAELAADAEVYCQYGISLAGLEALHASHTKQVNATTTTSDLCHTIIKPATVPAGWVDEVTLIDPEKRWFGHSYRESATGQTQQHSPPGTMSYCELLLADTATAHHVGRPTVFLSHAWLYLFLNVLSALRAFVASLPAGSPEVFFWFDCCSIDEHATQALPQEFWSSTFKEAIRIMGHTVMMLSPWDNPQPLNRAWCLWELHCTISVGAQFSVCLGPDEQVALEAALLDKGSTALQDAFSSIDIAEAEAGDPNDQAMILKAVRATAGGTSRLNALAMAEMRKWVRGVVAIMVTACRDPVDGSLLPARLGDVVSLACALDAIEHDVADLSVARQLFEEVVARQTELLGARHFETLMNKKIMVQVLKEMGERRAALRLCEEVVAGLQENMDNLEHIVTLEQGEEQLPQMIAVLEAKLLLARLSADKGEQRRLCDQLAKFAKQMFGTGHAVTLGANASVADLLHEIGDLGAARRLYNEVVAGKTELLGGGHVNTLAVKVNLATLLNDMGELAEARRLIEQAVVGFTEQLGPRHSRTQFAARILAKMDASTDYSGYTLV